ncbi:MAG TPA: ABC transporter substrate-binding protein [Acidimicrobiales bacterium]|nr:ABC transporter substrate-binding protein [Acidimicrobiales bacterium]
MKLSKLLAALLAVLALLAAGCGDDDDSVASSGDDTDVADDDETSTTEADDGTSADGPPIRIGAQDFGESAILAEIYGQVLEAEGYDVEQVGVGGFRDVLLGAFESGDVNLSPEYAASMLEFLNEGAGEATGDAEETVGLLQEKLTELGLQALAPAPAVDTNAFVVTAETAEAQGLSKLSDLPADGAGLTLGAPQDCETNPFCIPGLQRVYGVDLSGDFVPLDSGLVADALEAGEIQVGVLFSTSGRIADEGWVLLEDDMGMLAADNVVPVLSDELAEAYGDELVALLDEISAAIDTDTLTELNKRFDIDKEDAADIAADFIEEAGLAG